MDAFLQNRAEAGQHRDAAITEFVREAAYTWANRLLALRCMEARGLIDEIILQKDAYGGRSLQHHRFARREPERCSGEDEGLLSGTPAAKGRDEGIDEVFMAPDALGWTYQYWNTEEKKRVFEKVRTGKGTKVEGAERTTARARAQGASRNAGRSTPRRGLGRVEARCNRALEQALQRRDQCARRIYRVLW